jgi:hypothetical protein
MIDATYITLVNQNEVNMSLLQPKHHHVTSYHGKTETYEAHEPWFMIQLQENAHLYPPSSKADLEESIFLALDAVPLDSMRKSVQLPFNILTYWSDYCTGSPHVLDGKQAMWASKKHQGHQVLPDWILEEHNNTNNNWIIYTEPAKRT